MIDAALELGVGTVIVPWVNPASIADRAGVELLAGNINEAAAIAPNTGCAWAITP